MKEGTARKMQQVRGWQKGEGGTRCSHGRHPTTTRTTRTTTMVTRTMQHLKLSRDGGKRPLEELFFDFFLCLGYLDLLDGFGEMGGALVGEVVAVH